MGIQLTGKTAVDEGPQADYDVTLPSRSGHDQNRREGAVSSADRQSTELASVAANGWHADG